MKKYEKNLKKSVLQQSLLIIQIKLFDAGVCFLFFLYFRAYQYPFNCSIMAQRGKAVTWDSRIERKRRKRKQNHHLKKPIRNILSLIISAES